MGKAIEFEERVLYLGSLMLFKEILNGDIKNYY